MDLNSIITLKIPTIVIMGMLFWAGVHLLEASPAFLTSTGISGMILLGVGAILAIIAFIDYRYKEQTDSAIDQLTKTINALSRAAKSSAATNSTINNAHQQTIKGAQEIIGSAQRKYTVTAGDGTSTTGSSDE